MFGLFFKINLNLFKRKLWLKFYLFFLKGCNLEDKMKIR